MSTEDNNNLPHIKKLLGLKSALTPEQRIALRELFNSDYEKYKQELKAKYQDIAKSLVEQRERELLEQFKQEVMRIKSKESQELAIVQGQQKVLASSWHSEVLALRQELAQQQSIAQSNLEQAVERGRQLGVQQATEKYEHLLASQNNQFKHQQLQTTNLEPQLRRQIEAEFNDRMNAALEAERQQHNFATAQLKAKHTQEIIELETAIKNIGHTMDANPHHTRSEIEQRLQAEFDAKLEIYKAQIKLEQERAKIQAEFAGKQQELVAQEREKLNQQQALENQVILKQQQDRMAAQHQADLALQLANLSRKLNEEHRVAILAMERQHLQNVEQTVQQRLQSSQAEMRAALRQELRNEMLQEVRVSDAMSAPVDRAQIEREVEQRLRQEFQAMLDQQRRVADQKINQDKDQIVANALSLYKDKIEQQVKDSYSRESQKNAMQLKADMELQLEKERAKLIAEAGRDKLMALQEQERKIEQKLAQRMQELLDEERKKLGLKFAQDKADLIKELTESFAHEKQAAIEAYEKELRDTLYREMVKQKDYIQDKFLQGQQNALLEQKRRMEAEHRQEMERIKKGYFTPTENQEFTQPVLNTSKTRRNPAVVERGVEQLADRILAKFQVNKDKY